MADPYPEEQAQQWLDDLVVTTRLALGDIEKARKGWWDAGEELIEIAEQLSGASNPSSNRKAAWVGTASDAATAAFDALAQEFTRHGRAMQDLSLALAGGLEDVQRVTDVVSTQIGTTLKPKPKGGLFGTGIGPSLGPDVVEFVDDVADGVGAVAKNPTAIINKGALLGGPVAPLAALAVAGDNAERRELSREDQFRLIESTWRDFDSAASLHGEAVEGACTDTPGRWSQDYGGGMRFGDGAESDGPIEPQSGSPLGSRGYRAASMSGDPRLGPFASSGHSHGSIGESMPSLDERITADGAVRGFQAPPGVDRNPDGSAPHAPGGGGGSGGPGGGSGGGGLSGGGAAAAGAGASLAGVGGGLAGALGGAKAAAAGGLGAAPGVLGGSAAGAAGAKGNAMSMLGQGMGGGAGGGGDKKGGGKRYGDGPELGPRDRRRGVKHAVLGAGSRGGGNGGGETIEPESDDPFLDGG
ncbi:hypothetical protein [Sporichthya polymorpha]|uniref:hypothetical protein n=1 Tax=Sporichthya polymorpha TaxID=35751 RepID=UPI0012EBAC70|nr:hypothetical protein [Sporichthya polymorpha]